LRRDGARGGSPPYRAGRATTAGGGGRERADEGGRFPRGRLGQDRLEVVNGYRHVAPQTRARVQRAIDEMRYRPNLSARSLRSGRTGIIAIALPRLDEPYFSELAAAVIELADRRGCTVLVDQTDGLLEREQLAVDGIRPHLIDGLLLSPLALGAAELAPSGTPLILLGERISDSSFDHVAIDNVAAARLATEHRLARQDGAWALA
jgi:DNA-binding LacI/PurR family transcriptional regulator